MDNVVWALLGFILAREVICAYTTNKLINKLMSRNYNDYEQAKESYKPKRDKAPVANLEPVEDLGVLRDYSLG